MNILFIRGCKLVNKVIEKDIKCKLRESVLYVRMSKCYNKQCFLSQL